MNETPDFGEWTPPWDKIKQYAKESGFQDDGYGDIAACDWDCIVRLWYRIIIDERRKAMKSPIQ